MLQKYKVDNFVKKARAGSAPEDVIYQRMIMYCNKPRKILYYLPRDSWDKTCLVDIWKVELIYLPKEADAGQEKAGLKLAKCIWLDPATNFS